LDKHALTLKDRDHIVISERNVQRGKEVTEAVFGIHQGTPSQTLRRTGRSTKREKQPLAPERSSDMEYRHVNGPVYCRFAKTPPILNSEFAIRFGIEAFSEFDAAVVGTDSLKNGTDVKLRLLLNDRGQQMTCHAKIDYVVKDDATGECRIGFGSLSFSDQEFGILMESFTDLPSAPLELTGSVRTKGIDAMPVTSEPKLAEATRIKAITFPVILIDEIDLRRGETPFSEFVAAAVREYLQDRRKTE
jgi:hypothetical protein